MTIDEAKKQFSDRPEPAPLEFAGQWVAWSKDRSKIVAHGAKFDAVREAALAAGCSDPLMQRVLGTSFVGGA